MTAGPTISNPKPPPTDRFAIASPTGGWLGVYRPVTEARARAIWWTL
jgi:hypothetical protein